MAATNYTPVNHLLKKETPSHVSKPKEAEPGLVKIESGHLQEIVEHENMHEEVKPHIQIRKETIRLPESLKRIGATASTVSQFSTLRDVHIPISDDKVLLGLHAPITSSFRWLATLAMYMLRQAHLGLKQIHGKVVRVVRR